MAVKKTKKKAAKKKVAKKKGSMGKAAATEWASKISRQAKSGAKREKRADQIVNGDFERMAAKKLLAKKKKAAKKKVAKKKVKK